MKIIGYKLNNDDPCEFLPVAFKVENDTQIEHFEQNMEIVYKRNGEIVIIDAIVQRDQY